MGNLSSASRGEQLQETKSYLSTTTYVWSSPTFRGAPLPVEFQTLITVSLVPAALVVALVGPLHPLADPQLLQAVLVHLSLGQDKAQDATRKANHPIASTRRGKHGVSNCSCLFVAPKLKLKSTRQNLKMLIISCLPMLTNGVSLLAKQ